MKTISATLALAASLGAAQAFADQQYYDGNLWNISEHAVGFKDGIQTLSSAYLDDLHWLPNFAGERPLMNVTSLSKKRQTVIPHRRESSKTRRISTFRLISLRADREAIHVQSFAKFS